MVCKRIGGPRFQNLYCGNTAQNICTSRSSSSGQLHAKATEGSLNKKKHLMFRERAAILTTPTQPHIMVPGRWAQFQETRLRGLLPYHFKGSILRICLRLHFCPPRDMQQLSTEFSVGFCYLRCELLREGSILVDAVQRAPANACRIVPRGQAQQPSQVIGERDEP